MKIDQVILPSTPNPFYLDFWPIVANAWRDLIGIEPILIYVADDGATVSEEHGEVIRLPNVPGVPEYLQGVWSRYWIAQRWPDRVSIISDIDILPLSKRYFVDKLASIPDATYVHLDPGTDPKRIPACYHIAKGYNYREILGLDEKFATSLNRIIDYWKTRCPVKPITWWVSTEKFAAERIKLCNHYEPIMRTEGRIRRADWTYDIASLGEYADAHLLRPYSRYHVETNQLNAGIRQHCRTHNFSAKE